MPALFLFPGLTTDVFNECSSSEKYLPWMLNYRLRSYMNYTPKVYLMHYLSKESSSNKFEVNLRCISNLKPSMSLASTITPANVVSDFS